MPLPDLDQFDSALPQFEADGWIPQGADPATAGQAFAQKLDAEGYDTAHPSTQAIIRKVQGAVFRRNMAQGTPDQEFLAKVQPGVAPGEAARRYRVTQQPGYAEEMGDLAAKSESQLGGAIMGARRGLADMGAGVAGYLGATDIATGERMMSEQVRKNAPETAYHIGSMAGTLAPMAAGPVAMGIGMAGQGMSALQENDVGRLGQTAGGLTVGVAGAVLPGVGANLLMKPVVSAATKLGITAAAKTAAEVVSSQPTAQLVAGRVLLTGMEGAAQYPGMTTATAAGDLAGYAANGDPMEGLRRAWEAEKELGNPIGWAEFALLHTGMHTLGGGKVGSFSDRNAQGSMLDKAVVPYIQPEIGRKAIQREGYRDAYRNEQSTLADSEAQLEAQKQATAVSQQKADDSGYDLQAAEGERALAERRKAEAVDADISKQMEADTEWRGQDIADRKASGERFAAMRKAADDELAARDLHAEQQAARDKFAQEELDREEAHKAATEKAQQEATAAEAKRQEDELNTAAALEVEQKAAREKFAQDELDREEAHKKEVADAAQTLAYLRRRRAAAENSDEVLQQMKAKAGDLGPEIEGFHPHKSDLIRLDARMRVLQAKAESKFVPRAEPAAVREPIPEPELNARPLPAAKPFTPRQEPAALREPIPALSRPAKPVAKAETLSPERIDQILSNVAEPSATVSEAPAEPMAAAPRAAPAPFIKAEPELAKRIEAATTSKAKGKPPSLESIRAARPFLKGMNGYMGHKQETLPHAVQRIEDTIGPDAEKITTMNEPYGGSGTFGISLAMASPRLKNVRKIRVGEYNPEQHAAIKLVHTQGDQVPRLMGKYRIADELERLRSQIGNEGTGSAGGVAGRLKRLLDDGDYSHQPEEARALLKMAANWSRNNARGERDMTKVVKSVGEWAVNAHRTAKAFRDRGGEIEYFKPGDALSQLDTLGEKGNHVLELHDPPYFGTTGYDTPTTAADYQRTEKSLRSAAERGNNFLYHDEAWWTKNHAPGAKLPAELRDWKAAVPTLERIHGITDDLTAHPVAGRTETIGARNAFRSGPLAPERSGVAETGRAAESPGVSPVAEPGRGSSPRSAGEPVASEPRREVEGADRKPAAGGDRTVTDEHRRDAQGLVGIVGESPKLRIDEAGDLHIEGNGKHYRIRYSDLANTPADQINREAWLNSVLARIPASQRLTKLQEMFDAVGVPDSTISAMRRRGLPAAHETLKGMRDASWEKLAKRFPVEAKIATDEATGADVGTLIHLDQQFRGKEGGRLIEEAGHHAWLALAHDNAALAADVIRTAAAPAERREILGDGNRIQPGQENHALEVGTRLVNNALRRQMIREAGLPAATGWLGKIKRWLENKFSAKISTDITPADIVAKAWRENTRPAELHGKTSTGEAYAVGAEDASLGIRRSQAKEWEGKTTDEKVLDEARQIQGDSTRFAEAYDRIEKGEGSPAELRAMEESAQDNLAKAMTDGSLRHLEDGMKFSGVVQKALSKAGQTLRYGRRDLRDPDTVRGALLDTLANTGSLKWRTKLAKFAPGTEGRQKVADQWAAERRKMIDTIRERTGVDLTDPNLGQKMAGDAYAISALSDLIRRTEPMTRADTWKEWKDRATVGGLFAEFVRSNILTVGSFVPQVGQAGYFAAKSSMNRVADELLGRLKGREVRGFSGTAEALHHIGTDFIDGFKLAMESQYRGTSIVRERLRYLRATPSGEAETASGEGGKSLLPVWLRLPLGPGAALTGIADDMTWATAFRMSQSFEAARKRAAGDGRSISEIRNDEDVLAKAEQIADNATFRGEFTGATADLATGFGKLRSPTRKDAEGRTVTNVPGAFMYSFLPIYKSMVKGLQEGLAVANVPGNVMKLGKLRTGEKMDEHIRGEADRRQVPEEQIREEHYQAAVDASGRLMMGAVLGTVGALWAGVSNPSQDANEKRMKEKETTPGSIAGVPASRFSPAYEPTQIAGGIREAMKSYSASKDPKQALGEFTVSMYDSLLNRPLLQGIPDPSGRNNGRDPNTNESLSMLDKIGNQLVSESSPGRFYTDAWRRMNETTARRQSGGPWDRQYATQREERHSFTGEVENTGNFWRKLIVGGEGTPTEAEARIARRLVALNAQVSKGVSDPQIKKSLEWWATTLPNTEGVKNGRDYTYTSDELDEMRKVAGEAFTKFESRIPTSAPPAQQLLQLKLAWETSRAIARSAMRPTMMERVMAQPQQKPQR